MVWVSLACEEGTTLTCGATMLASCKETDTRGQHPSAFPELASPQVASGLAGLPAAKTNASGLSYTIIVEAARPQGIISRVAATVAIVPGNAGKPYQVLAWRQLYKSPFDEPSNSAHYNIAMEGIL